MSTYLLPFKKYATFSGRATRSEYWTFSLVNFFIAIVIYFPALALLSSEETMLLGGILLMAYYVFSLVILIPSLAVTARRLHDIGKSGWWQLIVFVPLVGPILMLVWLLTGSNPEANMYDGQSGSTPPPIV